MKQGTQSWLDKRKQYIGASDAPAVMKVSPWKTPFQLWEEKVGLRKEPGDNTAMKYGREMEEPARQAYERYTNNLVTPEVIFHPQIKYMMASLDGLSLNGDIILEIKNANEEDHALAEEGKIPEKYIPQLQHQLDCLPGSVLHYWSFRKGKGALVEVSRDEEYVKNLVLEEGCFWDKVLQFESPELIEADYLDFLGDQEWDKLARERIAINQLQQELEAREKDNRRAMLSKAGGHSVKGNGVKFTRYMERGRVNYAAIPELMGVNLDGYRKEPIEKWRISTYK